MRRVIPAIALFYALAAPAFAQHSVTPDLSGTWVLNPSMSRPVKRMIDTTETILIACSGNTISFDYTTNGKESKQSYIVDGVKRAAELQNDFVVYSKAQWRASTLVVENSVHMTAPGSPKVDRGTLLSFKRRWSLSSNGRILTEISDGPGPNQRVYVFEKQ